MTPTPTTKPVPRKPPTKRLFSGMAGSPLARVEENAQKPAQASVAVAVMEPEPIPAVESTPKKRGRPPKHDVAMTPAERKAASRANKKEKLEDVERRKLIAELMQIYRRQQSHIVDDPKRPDEVHKRRETAYMHRRLYLDGLIGLSLEQLKLTLDTQKQTPDTDGRLHNERSGEAKRSHGQSEIERLIAARQHDSSLEGEEQDPSMAAGFEVKPEGAGADSFETEDSMTDSADLRTGSAKPTFEPTADERWVKKTINKITSEMSFDTHDGAKCPFCFELFLTPFGVGNHLEDQYARGKNDVERLWEHTLVIARENSNPSMPGPGVSVPTEPNTKAYAHYKLIKEQIESVRKQARKKRSKGRFRDRAA